MGWISAIIASGQHAKCWVFCWQQLLSPCFCVTSAAPGNALGIWLNVLKTTEKVNHVQRQMLDAAARRPRDRDELVDRLRHGGF
jgi:hypothetical protein